MPPEKAIKKDDDKTPLHLLPHIALEGIASIFGFGQKKYSEYNWSLGFKHSRLYSACLRHLFAYWKGEDNDPESGKSHLYHAGCCIMMLIEHHDLQLGEDDRPTYLLNRQNIKFDENNEGRV